MPRLVVVLLRGGPDDLPRVMEAPVDEVGHRMSFPRGNGYEHFEFSEEYEDFDGRPAPVYRWSYRTAIAE
ncbi:DUF5988 family protein [Kitasatospora sp. MAP12-44]|uniref:DUF5988 family protein n=1 Tax=Kitasatospora sp. MAP12-9 TaxID=3035100 RepID=UPI0024746DA0|nr:DUF5988 family protein [Kitasatospora sp. MAP12-44]